MAGDARDVRGAVLYECGVCGVLACGMLVCAWVGGEREGRGDSGYGWSG